MLAVSRSGVNRSLNHGIRAVNQLWSQSYCSSTAEVGVASLAAVKSVIAVKGATSAQFLQGIVTNDTRPLDNEGAGPVYAAFLTPKGKLQYDAFLYRRPESTILLEVDTATKDDVLGWLKRYKLRKPVEIEDVSSQHCVWVQFGNGLPSEFSQGSWQADPRLPGLAYRALLPHQEQPTVSGSILLDELQYRKWRSFKGVAEGSGELGQGKFAPLELNLDVLHGVSYTKGCYIGQERTSFSHYRGIIRARLMPATVESTGGGSPPLLPLDTEVLSSSGEVVGSIRSSSGPLALLHVRLAPALAALQGGDGPPLRVSGHEGLVLRPFKPDWWAAEWGHEEEGQGAAKST